MRHRRCGAADLHRLRPKRWACGRTAPSQPAGRRLALCDTYECADGKWISIAALEPQFYYILEKLGISDPDQRQRDPAAWPALRQITDIFRGQPSAHWCALLEGTDVCFAPVLTLEEAACHPHNSARGTFFERDGVLQPSPAPRFSRTVTDRPGPAPFIGEHDDELM